jgi:hypothetical protein
MVGYKHFVPPGLNVVKLEIDALYNRIPAFSKEKEKQKTIFLTSSPPLEENEGR